MYVCMYVCIYVTAQIADMKMRYAPIEDVEHGIADKTNDLFVSYNSC